MNLLKRAHRSLVETSPVILELKQIRSEWFSDLIYYGTLFLNGNLRTWLTDNITMCPRGFMYRANDLFSLMALDVLVYDWESSLLLGLCLGDADGDLGDHVAEQTNGLMARK